MTKRSEFEWDSSKDKLNQEKHGVSFALAQLAFLDYNRVILRTLNTVMRKGGIIVLAESLAEL